MSVSAGFGASDDEILVSDRATSWRFDLLSTDEAPLGVLEGVMVGGSVEWIANASVKGGGQITVQDVGQDVDWLNVRIRPVALISGVGGSGALAEVPVGVFLPSAPGEAWNDLGRAWTIDLLDKNSVLDQDIYTDEDGVPTTYVAFVGEKVTDLVRALILGAGEAVPALVDSDVELTSSLFWDVGTTRLKIINDLLDAGGFFSLWVDGYGQYQATDYVLPAERATKFSVLAPFVVGPTSVWAPEWTNDRDIYSIPNRFVAVSQGDGEAEALVSTATNEDPASPFSFAARGRWITEVETGVEAVSQAALDLYAKRRLASLTSVGSTVEISHPHLPGMAVNDVLQLTNPGAGLDIRASVAKTSVVFDPIGLCQSTLTEVVVTS
jgi:hypothetical protein